MASDPAFLCYYKDILTSCADWEPDAFGWYFKLLCHQADKPEGLPNDVEALASICNVKFSQFQQFKTAWEKRIKEQFITNSAGLLVNEKQKEVLDKRRNYLDAQSIKGIIGAFIKRVRGLHDFTERQWKAASKYLIDNFDHIAFDEKEQVYLEAMLNSYAVSLATSSANSTAKSPAESPATSIYANGNVIVNAISDSEDFGKYENHFRGTVPADLRHYAANLPDSRREMNDREWQTVVKADLIKLGYKVSSEVEVPELKGRLNKKERCLDLVASKGFTVVAIELDNVTVNPVSLAKLRTYDIGMVLLRNPDTKQNIIKIDLPQKEMVSSSTVDVENPLLKDMLDEATRGNLIMTYRDVDVDDQFEKFKTKVKSAKKFYALHDLEGLRLAFQRQLQTAPKKSKNYAASKNDRSEFNQNELDIIANHLKKP
jgi:hypothetical protein